MAKYNGVDISAIKRNGVSIKEAKYNGVDLLETDITGSGVLSGSNYISTSGFKFWRRGGWPASQLSEDIRKDPTSQLYLLQVIVRSNGRVDLELASNNSKSQELIDAWETSGTLRLQARGLDKTLNAPNDLTEPYIFPNGSLSTAEFNAIGGGDLTLTFTAPSS